VDQRTDRTGKITVPVPDLNYHDNSHEVKATFKLGQLIPTAVIQTLPGEKYELSTACLARCSGLVSPIMDQMEIVTRWFHVTNDILWPEFEDFIDGRTQVAHPVLRFSGTVPDDRIGSYLGYQSRAALRSSNAMPIAAYYKIYDDWFRDDDLQSELFTELVAGDNMSAYDPTNFPNKVNYQMDYFHKANTEVQSGTAVEIPLISGGPIDVVADTFPTNPARIRRPSDGVALAGNLSAGSGTGFLREDDTTDVMLDPNGSLVVDVQGVAQTITALRTAIRTQELLEMENRVGSRHVETTLAHWGHRIPDYRAGRSELIGTNRAPMVISEVLATAEGADTEVGDFAGHGIAMDKGKDAYYTAHDHGILMAISYVIPKTSYQEGEHRLFDKTDRFDYPFLKLGSIGDQAIKNKEIYSLHSDPEGTFAYGPRYDEFRSYPNRTLGEFRTSLNHFTLTRIFGAEPSNNFIFAEVESGNHSRIFTDTTGDHIWASFFHKVIRRSPISKYGIPML
jgi:hypothetical protein